MKPYWKIAFKNYKGGWFYGRKKYHSLEEAREAAYKHDNWKRIDEFPKVLKDAELAKKRKKILRQIERDYV